MGLPQQIVMKDISFTLSHFSNDDDDADVCSDEGRQRINSNIEIPEPNYEF
jgi:hypothetical protein